MIWNKIVSFASLLTALPYAVVGLLQNTVCSVTQGYVIDNKTQSTVVLNCHYANKGLFADNVYIEVVDDTTDKTIVTIKPEVDSGYLPNILLIPTQTGGVSDILLSMDSGGSGGGGYYYLYSVKKGKLKTLFDSQQYVDSHPYSATFENGYIAKVTDGKNTFTIDLSQKGEEWLSKVYDDNGNVKTTEQPYVSPASTVFAYYNSTRQLYQLQVWRPVVGLYNADRLGYLVEQLERQGDKMVTYFVSLAVSRMQMAQR